MSSSVSTQQLLVDLNALLDILNLPFTLLSPTDLTPSLLLALLSALHPIPSLPLPVPPYPAPDPVHAMKLFLGILCADLLQVNPSPPIDPRALAAGQWDAVVRVGALLCDFARTRGLVLPSTLGSGTDTEYHSQMIHDHDCDQCEHDSALPRTHSPSTQTATSSRLSMHSRRLSSDTSFASSHTTTTATVSATSTTVPTRRPRCIHEVPEFPFALNDSHDMTNTTNPTTVPSPSPPSPPPSYPTAYHASPSSPSLTTDTPRRPWCIHEVPEPLYPQGSGTVHAPRVRHTGSIDKADEATELASFELAASAKHPSGSSSRHHRRQHRHSGEGSRKRADVSAHAHTAHTLALLRERAALLEALAELGVDGDG